MENQILLGLTRPRFVYTSYLYIDYLWVELFDKEDVGLTIFRTQSRLLITWVNLFEEDDL